ncbi:MULTISPECIES: hypothetical protein [Flavobacterium]|uniref:Uncharacterized protein n=1 Tax=Flavobacterium chungbukense TaxID=877464 RepID=A0ABP7XLH4_9FLAO|nr:MULTISPECIES: hypothetical protein [Flavobacterium]MCC4920658.1 hypothetical protein [Flavobacterium chungbukense]MCM0667077.1 hypothetical protein [Flavobacterium tyrosinilyticum]MCP2025133.1 hypothetical protein [Flavobacterium sp. HSC-32F16]
MSFENQNTEGATAKAIEEQTSKLPSDLFLYAALAAMGTSLTLKCLGRKHTALFVGQWASPFLLLGVYNKLVKLEGHDAEDKTVNG